MNSTSALFNTVIRLVFAVLLATALFFGEEGSAQQAKLSPQQQDTVQKLINGLNEYPGTTRRCLSSIQSFGNTDTVLVGKNIVCAKEWLRMIGNNKDTQVTRSQFQAWIRQLDRLYDCYRDFEGEKLRNEVILVTPPPISGAKDAPHAHHASVICLHLDEERMKKTLQEIRLQGSPTFMAMHEMAHIFSQHSPWVAENETAAELLHAYALERGGFKYGYPEGNSMQYSPSKGTQQRHGRIKAALENLKNDNIQPFTYEYGSAYQLYMLGLVEGLGWDTIKKAVQSYHNGTYTPTKTYDKSNVKAAKTHEFFDRVAHFHDEARARKSPTIPPASKNMTGAQALRHGPDKGELLDKYFTVPTTPIP